MRYNLLGGTGLFVSELSLGTMTFGASGQFEVMGSVEQAAADSMVNQALDAGVNLIDTVARLAIAWLLHQPAVTSVILGARKIDQLEDTLRAVDVSFTPEELKELDAVSALPLEYPAWMLDLWGKGRRDQVAAQRSARLS